MSKLRDEIEALDREAGALAAAADVAEAGGYREPGDEEAWRCGDPAGRSGKPCRLERDHEGWCSATGEELGQELERRAAERPKARGVVGRLTAYEVVVKLPAFMSGPRVQTFTRFYPDLATAQQDAGRLIDREFPGGDVLAVRLAPRDPRDARAQEED